MILIYVISAAVFAFILFAVGHKQGEKQGEKQALSRFSNLKVYQRISRGQHREFVASLVFDSDRSGLNSFPLKDVLTPANLEMIAYHVPGVKVNLNSIVLDCGVTELDARKKWPIYNAYWSQP